MLKKNMRRCPNEVIEKNKRFRHEIQESRIP
jgi:hypothetical protein